jgi:ethanolamine utilization protein EutN
MNLCRVEGNLTATRKHSSFQGWRFLICQPISPNGQPEGSSVVAIDGLGAALHERVLVSTDGMAARAAVKDPRSPARMMIVAIVDEVEAATKGAAR